MSEAFPSDGKDKANFYERPNISDVPASFEEALAESRGGDPVEWIPEAEKLMKNIADVIADGGSIAIISNTPETKGVFAGYYAVKIPEINIIDGNIELIERVVYATFEQVAIGHFKVPKEGLFCKDPEI